MVSKINKKLFEVDRSLYSDDDLDVLRDIFYHKTSLYLMPLQAYVTCRAFIKNNLEGLVTGDIKIDEVPLYIGYDESVINTVCSWRLKIGK